MSYCVLMFLFRYVLCVSCVSFCKDTKKITANILACIDIDFFLFYKESVMLSKKNIKDFKMGYFVYLSKNKIQ